ncbi:MAG: hypothetical protein FJ388_04385 [Verrucomicrobia bacterium]|nr:hypothetical protein [Verrucomicrobiota bacterium]
MTDPRDILFGQLNPAELLQGATGKGVKIAVVDSGVDNKHPDLAAHVKGGCVIAEEATGKIITKPYDGEDAAGHGTGCAGIIAKLAPEAEIYSVRVLACIGVGPDGYRMAAGKPKHLIYGLNWAIENCHVINASNGLIVSEGTAYFDAFHKIVEKAYYRDRILVAAGENQGYPSFPSVFSNLIKVYWDTYKDPFHFVYQLKPNTFTEFIAHGNRVTVPQPGGGYIEEFGTSFATPHVTAAVALLLSKYPGLKPFQVKSLIYAMSQKSAPSAGSV